MNSHAHKSTILTPEYDRIGIGVVFVENKGYYVTQDFIQSQKIVSGEEVLSKIINTLDGVRYRLSLNPLPLLESANTFARNYALNRAMGLKVPDIPDIFGETHLVTYTLPSFKELKPSLIKPSHPLYSAGGLGVAFGANKEYPGGAYYVAILLLLKNVHADMSEDALRNILLQAINSTRKSLRIPFMELDDKISYEASQLNRLFIAQPGTPASLPGLVNYAVVFYTTDNPAVIPFSLKVKLQDSRQRRIGIGIAPGDDPRLPRDVFWVTVIYK